jgi:hypothetical protein
VAGACGMVSYRLFQFRPSLPAGVVIDRQQAPALYQLVAETSAHYDGPRIERIVVTGEYQLDIATTPVSALPLWSTRNLVIGLPLLQCLSMTRFQCSLARRLGQYSGRSNRLLNWLYELRSIWAGYREPALAANPACLPVHALFSVYAPLYTVLSTVAARLDELQADSYAMELFSDEDVLDAVTTDVVYRLFLREKYWPAIRKLREQDATVVSNINDRMAAVLNIGLHAGNIAGWVEQAMLAEQQWDDPWPSLVRRIENIGHAQASMITEVIEPAADSYLDTARPKLEAALEAPLPPKFPQLQSWSADTDGLRRTVQLVMHTLLLRLKSMLHPREHAGEVKQ